MNGITLSATLLSIAAVVSPVLARHRVHPLPKRGWRPGRPGGLVFVGAGAAAVAATMLAPSALLAGAIIATTAAGRLRRRRRDRRRLDEGRAMAAALEVLVGELSVGAHPAAAFAVAAAESGDRVGDALRAVASRGQFGADVAEGIRSVAGTSAVPGYWNRLAVSWELAAEHGLAMSVLMRTAHRDIVDRQRFADRTHAALAGARATAGILAALPVLGVALGQLIGAHPIGFLLGSGLGALLLVGGVTLICAGVSWADRILDRIVA